MEPQLYCPACKQTILASYYFCPNCGKQLKDKPLSTTVTKQILIYLLSALLPPLGLWPGIKYLRQKDDKSRLIGLIAIILTIISTAVTIWWYIGFMNKVNQMLNQQLNGSLNM